jgi:hypothetical protein
MWHSPPRPLPSLPRSRWHWDNKLLRRASWWHVSWRIDVERTEEVEASMGTATTTVRSRVTTSGHSREASTNRATVRRLVTTVRRTRPHYIGRFCRSYPSLSFTMRTQQNGCRCISSSMHWGVGLNLWQQLRRSLTSMIIVVSYRICCRYGKRI